MLVDIVIPVAPFHQEVAQQAITSAHAQTMPSNVIVIQDVDRRGAAWARNQGAAMGHAPFIVFLDADDTLDSVFVAACLQQWTNTGGYIYTDWIRSGKRYAPDAKTNIFTTGMYHIVTTLLPRKAFDYVGGFDETLPTLEDEDLYRRIQRAGLCAFPVHEPLVEYRMHDGHSAAVRDTYMAQVEAYFNKRDSGFKGLNMCACNDAAPAGGTHISGQYHEGDILAIALYTPRRMTSKVIAHRVYEKPLMGQPMWVHPADVDMRPDLWQIALTKETLTPDVETVLSLLQSA